MIEKLQNFENSFVSSSEWLYKRLTLEQGENRGRICIAEIRRIHDN